MNLLHVSIYRGLQGIWMRTQNYTPSSEPSERQFCSSNLLFFWLSFAEQYFFIVALCQGLLQYMCFATRNLSRGRTRSTLSPMSSYNLSLPVKFPIDSWVAGWLHLSLSTLEELYLYEVDYNNSSSCPEALTHTRTLNWDDPYFLQCYQTLVPVMGGLQKNQGISCDSVSKLCDSSQFSVRMINKIIFFNAHNRRTEAAPQSA